MGLVIPDRTEHLWISCVNIGNQPIICNSFSFTTNKFRKKALHIMPNSLTVIKSISSTLPYTMPYSGRVDQCLDLKFFSENTFKTLVYQYKWLAKIQLKLFWRVVANTNIRSFQRNISENVIDEISEARFKKPDSK